MGGDTLDTVWRVASTTTRLFRPGEEDRVEAAREAAEERRRRREAALRRGSPPRATPDDVATTQAGSRTPDAPAIGSRLDVRV
jgi:hypothetical protein